ncbi:MAG: N-glycosylase/DNA lyase [Anaerolineae bacterium]
MNANRFDEFVQLLTQLPIDVWQAAVLEEPEWKWMLPLSKVWEFGHFAVLFVVLGLNDYQTKGKADVGYWPKVVPLIRQGSEPKDLLQLIDVLEPFFIRERFGQNKTKRLKRFLESNLCREIWVSSPSSLAANFGRIWHSLGLAMRQKSTDKTIAFAMKCLALALLMANETKFDFGAIPVPVDSRIRNISTRLGLTSGDEATERERWRRVLDRIRESHPEITMVHLDSLLWQIGTLSPQEMKSHLVKLGSGSLAPRISQLFYRF